MLRFLSWMILGLLMSLMLNPARAQVILGVDERLCRTDSRAFLYHLSKGEFERGRNNINLAISHYSCALRLDANNAIAYHGRGFSFALRGDLSSALSDLNMALDIDPQNPEYLASRAYVFRRLESWQAALDDLNRAIAFDPEYARAYNSRAITYENLDQSERAILDYEQAGKLGTDEPESPFWNLGNLYLEQGEIWRAMSAFERAVMANPRYAPAYKAMGDIYVQVGDLGKAREQYEAYVLLENRADSSVLVYVEWGITLRNAQRLAPSLLAVLLFLYLLIAWGRDAWRVWQTWSKPRHPAL